jgi:hypothetical protein
MVAPEVTENDLVADGDERLMRALAALDARLLADTANPLVGARRRVALSILPRVDPELGEHVDPTAEEAPE